MKGAYFLLMAKVTLSCENHTKASFVGLLDHFFVLDRSSRLDESLDPRVRGRLDAICEREESIACEDQFS